MRPTSDLAKLQDAAQSRLIRVRNIFYRGLESPAGDRSTYIAQAVIELDNLLVGALRQFILSTLFRARTSQGRRIQTSRRFQDEGEARAFILSIVNTRRYANLKEPKSISRREEPTIREPRQAEQVLAACGASNLISVQNALALNVAAFQDLATLRNFYAHRNEDTCRKAQDKAVRLGILAANHPDDMVTAFPLGQTLMLFDSWVSEAQYFFEEIMK